MSFPKKLLGAVLSLGVLVASTPSVHGNLKRVEPGCTGSHTENMQHIKFNGGPDLFEVFVPTDGQTYSMTASSPQLKCSESSSKTRPCITCDVVMDHVQLFGDGTCDITVFTPDGSQHSDWQVKESDGKLFFGTAGIVSDVSCFAPQAKAARDEPLNGTCLKDTHGVEVWLHMANNDYYLLTIPNDKNEYIINGPDTQLYCTGPSTEIYTPCEPCEGEVSDVSVSYAAGVCRLNFADVEHPVLVDNESGNSSTPMEILKPARLISAQCGLTKQDIESSQPVASKAICVEDTLGSMLSLTTVDGNYSLSIPANKTVFNIIGPDAQLKCVGALGTKYSQCTTCDHDVLQMNVSESAGICAFHLGYGSRHYNDTFYWSHSKGTAKFKIPGTIFDARCGLTPHDVLDLGGLPPSLLSRDVAHTVPVSLSAECPPSQLYHIIITALDGNTYFAPVPHDGQIHAMAGMSCVRLNDAACIPCSQIGAAIGVSCNKDASPCTFSFENPASEAHIPWTPQDPHDLADNVTPIVLVNVPSVITGIQCGA